MLMKTDAQLRNDVMDELDWEPAIKSTNVGVAVKDGVVTLTGHLDTYAEKYAIERVAQRVEGVKAVALELDVKLAPDHRRSDTEIATAIENALTWHVLIPSERIRVSVEKGWVTLTGELDWAYQRNDTEQAVRPLTGVVGVTNRISIKPKTSPSNITNRIRDALARHAEHSAKHIEVTVSGNSVTLQGKVSSWAERQAAQGAAWSAPGITDVTNKIEISG
ncbi:MAG: BON domain-containing protein [Burkholderiales bacterium]|jgi:osmotically-inducible protein OsmY